MDTLKRKIETTLVAWKEKDGHKPLVIKGCRQCGKTFTVMHFAEAHYSHVVYVNFMENDDFQLAFKQSKKVDDITMNLSAMIPSARFNPKDTCIILDEIQECPDARSALKFFKLDGRYDVIATGSLLGVKGYGTHGSKASIPVGYEQNEEMYPLDFEEFLWAMGIDDDIISYITSCKDEVKPVNDAIHQRLSQLVRQYIIVGGMPEAVANFVQNRNMGEVLQIQRDIIGGYKEDMLKYAPETDKPRIRQCFESIPRQLAKENKKFQYSVVQKGGKASQFLGSLQWIEDAGIICRCYNLHITELPLDGNADETTFKVYMADTGLFVSMLEDGTQADILQGNLYGYKGAIYENVIADMLHKTGRKLYYFRKDSGLEVDFVIRYKGECVLLEVKAKDGNTKSTRTILSHPEKYHVHHAIKLGNYNVGLKDGILTLPLYMGFLLR